MQGGEETRREVYWSMSSQQCAVFQGLQSSPCLQKSSKSALKAPANNGAHREVNNLLLLHAIPC